VTWLRSTLYLLMFSLWTVLVAVLFTPILLGPRSWSHWMFNF